MASSSPIAGTLRLQLSHSSSGIGALDGAWWPYSRDLAAEASHLVDQFPEWFGRIWRVVYSAPDWDAVTRRRLEAAKVFVSLASFPGDDTHRVLLRSVSSSRILQLLVIPSDCDARTARRAMRVAADGSNTASAATILGRYEIGARPDASGPARSPLGSPSFQQLRTG